MTESIAIIGGGIGGLTTALMLKRKGIEATIYESAQEIRPVGAGIVLANNAMQVFQKLGIRDQLEKAGHTISRAKITDENLNIISTMDLSKFEHKYGVRNVAIHRGDLQKILAEEIGYENIRLSKRLIKIERNGIFKLAFDDNTHVNSDVVIGADGIKSTVRNQLFSKATIRDTRQICWRGVCEPDLPERYNHEATEAWGKGKRFGFVKINSKKVYWFAVANEWMVKNKEVELSNLYKEFSPGILKIISATPKHEIFESRLADLKPIAKWHDQGVCLIGDAAHATTPNLGQGACQAIEDAFALGQLFETGNTTARVFAEYEQLRIKKAHQIVKQSWVLGKVAHAENGLMVWLRNMMMRNLPDALNEKQLDEIFDIRYIPYV